MQFIYDDGGRAAAGYNGKARDCVCRSLAIASGRPYREVYERLAKGRGNQRASTRISKKAASARNGINVRRKWFRDYMAELGAIWTPTMHIGSGCKVHLKERELPNGRLMVSVSRHYTTVINGVIHDTHNPHREGNRCIYGYWNFA